MLQIGKSKIRPNTAREIIKSKDINYIQEAWLDIFDEEGNKIGILTGYQMNMPLLTSDILTICESKLHFDQVSSLCSRLWTFLHTYIDLLKGKAGELYFLNNLYIKGTEIERASDVLTILKNQYEVVIYSFGSTEDFEPFLYNWQPEEITKHIGMLLTSGWIFNDDYGFYLHSKERCQKRLLKAHIEYNCKVNLLLEDWVKWMGEDWLNSMWRGTFKQPVYEYEREQIASGKEDVEILPLHFLTKMNITDFKQVRFFSTRKTPKFKEAKPSNSKRDEDFLYTKWLLNLMFAVNYQKKKFFIRYKEDIDTTNDMNKLITVSINEYKINDSGKSIIQEGPLTAKSQIWLEPIFEDFINRIKGQFEVETNMVRGYLYSFKTMKTKRG